MNTLTENAKILNSQTSPKTSRHWSILTVHAPKSAQHILAGHSVHTQCGTLPATQVMLTNKNRGTLDLLYLELDMEAQALIEKKQGDTLSLISSMKQTFDYHPEYPRPLLIGEEQGLAAITLLASQLRHDKNCKPLIIMGSKLSFPFRPIPSQFIIQGIPDGITATMPLLEDWNMPSRLASSKNFPGCFDGSATDLALRWVEALPENQRTDVEIFACGTQSMLNSAQELATRYRLPCQTSLIHT